ncbi:MAG TPA: BTAD domain-containing putative transcriptional regulator [Gemmatimonadales bacterium]|nr:BTAD domain-containing putative transcriptional regulator [Gemmatimonadales bacterium]
MIELRTLGALELTSAENTAAGSVLAQPRRAALLCYLALALPRGFHRRDTLFALFWPEEDAEQARHALRQSVYFLRRALRPETIISRGDEELALAREQVTCDVWAFDAAVDDRRPADALALYRGELLAGFHISDAPDFERWLDQERSRLRQRAGEAGWGLAAARERDGDASGAVEAARRAADLAPTDETALRRLVLLLERLGDRAAAVRAYDAFAWRLEGEYELEPSAETRALMARIRAQPKESQAEALDHQSRIPPAAQDGNSKAGTLGAGSSTGPPPSPAATVRVEAGSVVPIWLKRTWAAWKRVGITAAILAALMAAGWAIRDHLRPATLGIRRLAVLPLANLTGDGRQEYFVDGMHEALVTELSQVPGLTVISRQSTVQYRGTDRPVPVIARELGVDALLEGSVFRAEDSVRITVQLVHADPEGHMWAGTYQGELRNAITLQAEVARAVGQAIHARAAPERDERLAGRSVNPEAQEAYLRGLYHLERQMVTLELSSSDRLKTLRTAVANLENAVALAPDWATAHAKLARAYHWIASSYDQLAREFYPKSKAAAVRALELDPNEAQAHASLGFVQFNYEWDWEGAERSIRQAMALDPNSYHWIYAMFLIAVGRYDEAIAHYQQAQERNPLSQLLKGQLAYAYSCAGRQDEAIAELEELRARIGGSSDWLRTAFGEIYLMKSMYPEAIAALESAVTVSDSDPEIVALLAYGYARTGRMRDAHRLVPWLEQRSGRWYAPQLYTALGDTGRAVAMVRSAFEQRSSKILYLRCSTAYPALRNQPQIREIVRRIGIPE